MRSIRGKIFALVAAATVIVWSSAAAWSYLSTRAHVQRVLDRRLVEAATMVGSLAVNSPAIANAGPSLAAPDSYSRQLSCQIWTVDGRLVGRSSGAPMRPLAASGSGFSESIIDGQNWRVYSLVDSRQGLRIVVGDNLSVRQNLIGDVMMGLLVPAMAGVIALAFLIWMAVGRGIDPLWQIARSLERRELSDARPLPLGKVRELQPVLRAINGLFERLDRVRANERHFISSAAHELQTPLAGLRTHTQVALRARDNETREASLLAIEASVERTSRLVRQLLDLAREEAQVETAGPALTAVQPILASVLAELSYVLDGRHVQIRRSVPPDFCLPIDAASLSLALRNLIENAARYAPEGSTVEIAAEETGGLKKLVIADSGPGIPPSEMDHVRKRFVRLAGTKAPGSGLGLSIAEIALARNSASLDLSNREGGGLNAAIVVRSARSRSG